MDVSNVRTLRLVTPEPIDATASPPTSNPRARLLAVKYGIDRVVALLALLLFLPLLIGTAIAVWVSLGRPIFFRQVRVGRNGRRFEMLKFRTMREASWDDEHEARFELLPGTAPGGVEGDDRRTRVGAFLRRTSIDELPQLINVLKGEMSLVGPRPERPEFVGVFEQSVPGYADRHRVKPGMTGWAQVNGLRGQTSLVDRIDRDNHYIENWSLTLDLMIVVMTPGAAVRSS
jgi:lipopolysaccharide/colanic/teichoic acid biosynthesis glycosyltransferase